MLSSTQLAKINNETKIRSEITDEERERLKKFRQFKLGGRKKRRRKYRCFQPTVFFVGEVRHSTIYYSTGLNLVTAFARNGYNTN